MTTERTLRATERRLQGRFAWFLGLGAAVAIASWVLHAVGLDGGGGLGAVVGTIATLATSVGGLMLGSVIWKARERGVTKALTSIADFTPDFLYAQTDDFARGIAIDRTRRKLAVAQMTASSDRVGVLVYDIDRLTRLEWDLGEGVMSQESRSLGASGAIVGGAAFGVLGAILGGVMTSEKQVSGIHVISHVRLEIETATTRESYLFLRDGGPVQQVAGRWDFKKAAEACKLLEELRRRRQP